MARIALLTAIAVLLVALYGSSDHTLALAARKAPEQSKTATKPKTVTYVRPKRLKELLAAQRIREAGSARQQAQIARIRQRTGDTQRTGYSQRSGDSPYDRQDTQGTYDSQRTYETQRTYNTQRPYNSQGTYDRQGTYDALRRTDDY